jgi:hypothetical protein
MKRPFLFSVIIWEWVCLIKDRIVLQTCTVSNTMPRGLIVYVTSSAHMSTHF